MALWDKLKVELDRAGRVAQGALDESKLRLEAFRARQLADRAAQSLGWAIYHAHVRGEPLADAAQKRMIDALAERDQAVSVIEAKLREAERPAGPADASAPAASSAADAKTSADATEMENPSPS
jgi:hypothetical protein